MRRNTNITPVAPGTRFGLLTVIRLVPRRRGQKRALWLCKCDCGKTCEARADRLQQGTKKACGLGHHSSKNRTRGYPGERRCYNAMLSRCHNPRIKMYKYYGAKGIAVCDRWRTSFDNFFEDMGPRPSPQHSLDRFPDRKGNYEPGNVRWATPLQQAKNRDCYAVVVFKGKEVRVSDYAKRHGLNSRMIRKRLQRGWSPQRAFTERPRDQVHWSAHIDPATLSPLPPKPPS